MESINVVEWNINQRSNNKSIDLFVAYELTKTKPHVIFVVEYKEDKVFENNIRMNGYNVYSTGKIKGKNEVLIAIRNDGIFTNIKKNIEYLPNSLDILSIELSFNNKNICLIGARIQIGLGNLEDYMDRSRQLNDLFTYTKLIKNKFDSIIIAGDFNHGQIREAYNDNFLYKGYLQESCNYQKIKRIFKEIDCKVCTPEGDNKNVFSWVGKINDRKNGRNNLYYIKEDHLIISNNILLNTINYEWDYVNNKNYIDLSMYDYKSEFIGLPDHAKLVANVSI